MSSLQEVSVAYFMQAFVSGENLLPTFKIPKLDMADSVSERGTYPGLCTFFNEVFRESGCAYLSAYSSDDHGEQAAPGVDNRHPSIGVYSTLAPAKRAHEEAHEHSTHRARNICASEARATTTEAEHGPVDREISDATDEVGSGSDDGDPLSLVSRTAWAGAELLVEVNSDLNNTSSPHRAQNTVPLDDFERQLTQGQIMHYAQEVFSRQHRIFVFIIAVRGRSARLCLFDRAGAVISALFDYIDDPATLATFLYRFCNMTREQRGYDTTATLATREQETHFRALWNNLKVCPDPKSAISIGLKRAATPGWPIYVLDVFGPCSKDGSSLKVTKDTKPAHYRCLVGRPMFVSASLTGQGTRCFVAWNEAESKAVLIKDSWRAESDDIPSEFDNYQRLYEKSLGDLGKRLIPTVLAGGDVMSPLNPEDQPHSVPSSQSERTESDATSRPGTQPTLWQETRTHGEEQKTLRRRHCRLVLKEVCRSLEDFKHPKELVLAIMVAIMAHGMAWEKAELLHRDISVGNILIYDPPDGTPTQYLLADWDLAKTKEQLDKRKPTQQSRSGTWQFLSALLQCFPHKPYQLSDDLESFIHVLNWCALKYLRHSLSGEENAAKLSHNFHNLYDRQVTSSQTNTKLLTIRAGLLFVDGLDNQNPLKVLLKRLAVMCKTHYETVNFADLEAPTVKPAPVSTDWVQPDPEDGDDYFAQFVDVCRPGGSTEALQLPEPAPLAAKPVTSPFEKHDTILDAFRAVLTSPQGKGAVLPWPQDFVKMKDQIPKLIRQPTISTTGTKRDVDSRHDDEPEEPAAKQKKTHREMVGRSGTPGQSQPSSADTSQHPGSALSLFGDDSRGGYATPPLPGSSAGSRSASREPRAAHQSLANVQARASRPPSRTPPVDLGEGRAGSPGTGKGKGKGRAT